MSSSPQLLEQRIGYQFRDKTLLERALTHRSYLFERLPPEARTGGAKDNNESLEFLGDAVLGFLVSETLFRDHPEANEGQLSSWRAQVVSAGHLHQCALELKLGEFLRLGKAEERNGGRERKTMLADAVEATLAALYLDGGMEAARRFVEQHVLVQDGEPPVDLLNYKSMLQEAAQARGLPVPRYAIVESAGPEHARLFTVEVSIGDLFSDRAEGTTKKIASQQAAKLLNERLEATNWKAEMLAK